MMNLDNVKTLLNEETTLSLYLNVDNAVRENQATTPAWRIEMKNRLRDLEAALDESQQDTWKGVVERLELYLKAYVPRSKGLVLFVTPSDVQAHELPVPVENQAGFGRPLVAPLLWAMDEYEPYLVVTVDQEEAHFYLSYLGGTEFEEGMEIDLEEYDFGQKTLMPSASAVTGGHMLTQGNQRGEFEDMINEHRARFYRDVVQAAQRIADRNDADRIIIGGSEQSAHAVHNLMDDTLKARVVTVESIPMRYSPKEVFDHIEQTALNHERDQELELVKQVIDFAKSGGRGALGRKDVQRALEMQQVEMLVLSWPPQDGSMDGLNSLLQQVLELNSKIELVHSAAANLLNDEAGGIAARLYYAL